MIKYFKKHPCLTAFLLSFILGSLIILPSIISGKGIFTFIADFNYQQIPFNELINRIFKNGDFFYTWLNDLGSNTIATFSFYNMFSPFNLITYLFPSNWFPYLIGPMFILKYAIAGLTSYMFISHYVKNKKWAIIGSLLYAFSGFQLTNTLFYHFHDVVALFPLLLYALDRLVLDRKKGLFALIVALLAFTNWFFFIGEVVFLIIYYLVRVFTKSYFFTWKSFGCIIFEGILGTALASIILLPSIFFTLGNPRVDGNWTFSSAFKPTVYYLAEGLKSFVYPNDSMSFQSLFSEADYNSCAAFLPLIGLILPLGYILKKPKDSWSILIYVCVLFMLVPILNSSFYLFRVVFYARWYYMPILILSLISSMTLDRYYDIKKGWLVNLSLVFLLLGVIVYLGFIRHHDVIFNEAGFIVRIVLLGISIFYVLFIFLRYKNNELKLFNSLLVGIILYVSFMGNYFIYENKKTFKNDINYINYLHSSNYLDIDTSSYRADALPSCPFNIGNLTDNIIIHSFNSNISGGAFTFYNSVDLNRVVTTILEQDEDEIRNFLSVRYLISCGIQDSQYLEENGYELVSKNDLYSVYENSSVLPMGIGYRYFIETEDYMKLSSVEKRFILDKAVVLTDPNLLDLTEYKGENDYRLNISNEAFSFVKNGFNATIESDEDGYVLFTIPYDTGFTITNNGEEISYLETGNGFMLIPISKGKNDIRGNYIPVSFKEGTILSISSFLIYCVYIGFSYHKRFKKNNI